jgi:hypothetical protein
MEKVAGRGAAPSEASPRQIVTICAECRRVISMRGQPASPSSDSSGDGLLVSHGICEECARRLYGPIFNRKG